MLVIAIGLALLASCFWGVADFLGGVTSRRLSVLTVLLWSQPAGLLLLGVLLLLRHQGVALDGATWPAVAAGVASVTSLSLFYLAMSTGSIVVVAPIEASGVAVPVIIGFATGDPVTPISVAGIVCVLVGIVLVSRGADDGRATTSNRPAALLALGAALSYGAFLTLLKLSAEHDPIGSTTIMRASSLICIVVAYIAVRRQTSTRAHSATVDRPRRPGHADTRSAPTVDADRMSGVVAPERTAQPALPKLFVLAALLVGLADAGAEVSYAVATTGAELSTAAVLSSLYPAVTMFLAVIVLKERPQPGQILGAVVALVGVLLLSASS